MSIVLFCGAGFSAPFGLPTMNQFFPVAYASKRLSEAEKSLLADIQQEARAANAFRESSPTNLEDILTLAVMGDWLGLSDEDRGDKIKQILTKVYSSVDGNVSNFWDGHDRLGQMLGKKEDTNIDVAFITTNYDVLLECSAYASGVSCSLSGVTGNFHGHEKVQVEGDLYSGHNPIFKLHGSANWYQIEGDELTIEGRVVRIKPTYDANREIVHNRTMPLVSTSDYKPPPNGVPLLVPPSFMKPDNKVLQAVWQGAAQALAEAEMLIFIGYSFPPSDTVMGYFLARSLEKNVRLSKIAIVDLNANSIVSRLRSPESGFGSHFRALLEPHEKSWIDFNISQIGGDKRPPKPRAGVW